VTYEISERQFNVVLALSNEGRYRYFVTKVAFWQQLWGIRAGDHWLVPTTPEGVEYFPLWPHPEFVRQVAGENWSGYQVAELDYEFMITVGLEELANDDAKIAVFPNMAWQSVFIDGRRLLRDLLIEGQRYE